MAEKKIYIGDQGPSLYGDDDLVDDPDGDWAGVTQKAFLTDGDFYVSGNLRAGTLSLDDTDASHYLTLKWNENDTSNRSLNLLVAGGNRSLTLNEDFTVGDGYAGTLTFSAASKVLTVEDTSVLDQDLTKDAGPTFGEIVLTPKAESSGPEGTIFYCSDDNQVYVGTE